MKTPAERGMSSAIPAPRWRRHAPAIGVRESRQSAVGAFPMRRLARVMVCLAATGIIIVGHECSFVMLFRWCCATTSICRNTFGMAMENKFLKYLGYSTMALLLVVFTIIILRWGINFLDWARFDAGDLGTWVGAVGTVGALFGTVVLARSETRRRLRQEHDAAVIAAAFIDLPLEVYRRTLRTVIEGLKRPVEDNFDNPWEQLALELGQLPTWTREDLQPLLYLGNHIAAHLAVAQDFVRNSKDRLEAIASQKAAGVIDLHELSEFNEETRLVLDEALRRVSIASDDCSMLLEVSRVF